MRRNRSTARDSGDRRAKAEKYTTEMKFVFVILDEDERAKGRGFVKRVKDRWDVKYSRHESASLQKLRDNVAHFNWTQK